MCELNSFIYGDTKPTECCYPKCFYCTYDDCKYDKLERYDIELQDKFDRDLEAVDPEIRSRRIRQNRYFHSLKGKAAQKRYLQSDKGKEMQKRKNKKKIDSGKNAEYCRTYYQKHKEKLREKAKERYKIKHQTE